MTRAQAPVPLRLALQPDIERLLHPLRQVEGVRSLSEWSFANLFLYREAHDYRYIGGCRPRIEGHTYDGTAHVFPLFPTEEVAEAEWRGLLPAGTCLYPMTEAQCLRLNPEVFVSTRVEDDSDYVYAVANFVSYPGPPLRKKRNLAKQFHAAHRLEARRYGAAHEGAACAVLDGWMIDKAKAPGDADDGPTREALAYAARLGLEGYLYLADDLPAGFILAERLAPGVAVVRFAKALVRFKGLAQAMFQHFAAHAPWPLDFLNFEQDLGLANFRRTKQSYQPTELLAKWRVGFRSGMPVQAMRGSDVAIPHKTSPRPAANIEPVPISRTES